MGHNQGVVCFFAQFSKEPCRGIIEACHLIDKQALAREAGEDVVWDVRSFVPGCRWHHADFDHRQLDIPREALPEALQSFAEGLDEGLGREFFQAWLDRRYGPLKPPPTEGQTNVWEAIHRAEGVRDDD